MERGKALFPHINKDLCQSFCVSFNAAAAKGQNSAEEKSRQKEKLCEPRDGCESLQVKPVYAQTHCRNQTHASQPYPKQAKDQNFCTSVQDQQNANRDGELLGYEWIEVLAIEPWRFIRDPETDCAGIYDIRCYYICRTPHGIDRITSHDLWHAIDELREYEEE